MTLRELYVHGLLLYGHPPRMCVSDRFAEEPLGRGVSARLYSPGGLVEFVCDWLARRGEVGAEESVFQALAFDGRHAHVIVLIALAEDGSVCYRDPQPGVSLFSAASGSAAAADPDPQLPDVWRLSRDALARMLVAILRPPVGAKEKLQSIRTETDETAAMTIAWVSNRPGSRLAVTLSAMWFARALEERGHTEEAIHWWRQAAVVGGREGCLELALRLPEGSAERRYWERMDDLARRGRNRWTMPDETPPEAEEVRYNKQADDAQAAEEFPVALGLASAGRLAEAKRHFVAIRERGSDLERAAASFFIGKIWRDQGTPAAAAIPLFETAASANLSLIGSACVELAETELELGHDESALDAFERGAFCGDERAAAHCAKRLTELSGDW